MEINFKQKNYLRKAKEKGHLSHAYLFVGPEKTGKRQAAHWLMGEMNRFSPDDLSRAVRGEHPDVFVIRPEVKKKGEKSRKADISIEQLRKILEKTSLHPYQAKFKIILIEEAERITSTAANSLLKLIEEPKADTKIILVAHREEAVLATIRSRCQIIRFGYADKEEIKQHLLEKYPASPEEVLAEALTLAGGQAALAEEYLLSEAKRSKAQANLEAFRSALKGGLSSSLELAGSLGDDRAAALDQLERWIVYLRLFLIERVAHGDDQRVVGKVHQLLARLVRIHFLARTTNVGLKIQLENYFIQNS